MPSKEDESSSGNGPNEHWLRPSTGAARAAPSGVEKLDRDGLEGTDDDLLDLLDHDSDDLSLGILDSAARLIKSLVPNSLQDAAEESHLTNSLRQLYYDDYYYSQDCTADSDCDDPTPKCQCPTYRRRMLGLRKGALSLPKDPTDVADEADDKEKYGFDVDFSNGHRRAKSSKMSKSSCYPAGSGTCVAKSTKG